MRQYGKLLCALAALSASFAATSSSAKDKIPPELAAKRSGKAKQSAVGSPEMVYTPIAPCRAFGSQDVAARTNKIVQITGSASMTAQGGPAAGCGIPSSAQAVSINLSASSGATGALNAYPAGTQNRLLASLNFRAGQTDTAGSNVALNSSGQMAVWSSVASRIYGDVTGYYQPQMAAYILAGGGAAVQTSRLLSSAKTGVGSYALQWDRDVTYCMVVATPDNSGGYSSGYTYGNYAYINMYSAGGGLVDAWFNVIVIC